MTSTFRQQRVNQTRLPQAHGALTSYPASTGCAPSIPGGEKTPAYHHAQSECDPTARCLEYCGRWQRNLHDHGRTRLMGSPWHRPRRHQLRPRRQGRLVQPSTATSLLSAPASGAHHLELRQHLRGHPPTPAAPDLAATREVIRGVTPGQSWCAKGWVRRTWEELTEDRRLAVPLRRHASEPAPLGRCRLHAADLPSGEGTHSERLVRGAHARVGVGRLRWGAGP